MPIELGVIICSLLSIISIVMSTNAVNEKDSVNAKLKKLDSTINGFKSFYLDNDSRERVVIEELGVKSELKKLKEIVAELTDYVYQEKK